MRTTQRDRRTIYYALYQGVIEAVDADGNYTGEQEISYATPVEAHMNVSGGRGASAVEEFGTDNPFTHTAVTEDLTTAFDTNTVFWFKKTPSEGAYNFRCTGVADTVNGRTIALQEVSIEDNHVVSG